MSRIQDVSTFRAQVSDRVWLQKSHVAAGSTDIFDAAAVMTVPGYLIKQALQHDADQSKISWREYNTARQRSASDPSTTTCIRSLKIPGKHWIALE